jgi:hypothetical protein
MRRTAATAVALGLWLLASPRDRADAFVEAGGLMAYGPSLAGMIERSVYYRKRSSGVPSE